MQGWGLFHLTQSGVKEGLRNMVTTEQRAEGKGSAFSAVETKCWILGLGPTGIRWESGSK